MTVLSLACDGKFVIGSWVLEVLTAARYSHIQFHEVHRECGHRIQQQLYCPYHKRVVQRDEIVLGYEAGAGKMVIVDPKELKSLEPRSGRSLDLRAVAPFLETILTSKVP